MQKGAFCRTKEIQATASKNFILVIDEIKKIKNEKKIAYALTDYIHVK